MPYLGMRRFSSAISAITLAAAGLAAGSLATATPAHAAGTYSLVILP